MKILFVQKVRFGRFEMAAAFYFPVELARLGHDVTVAAPTGGDASAYLAAGVKVAEVGAEENWLLGLNRIAKLARPDIVHVFIHAGCGLCPFVMRLGWTAPKFVLDIRSPLLRTGLLRKLVQYKNRLEIAGYSFVFAHSIESAHTVIGKSSNMVLAPPGIDFGNLPEVGRIARDVGGELRLVYVGSIDVKRHLDQMIRAVCLARKSIPLTLDLYGEGNAVDALRSLVDGNGMQDRVRFKGKVDRIRLLGIIGSYDAGLSYIPKRLYNAAPALKTLEYLACGIPVIATDTDGNRTFVQDGKNGVLADCTPEAYADAITRFAVGDVCSLSPEELRRGVIDYDWKTIVKAKLVPVYRKLSTNEGAQP